MKADSGYLELGFGAGVDGKNITWHLFQGENVIRLDCSYVTLSNVLNVKKKRQANFIICRLISLAAATNGKKPF